MIQISICSRDDYVGMKFYGRNNNDIVWQNRPKKKSIDKTENKNVCIRY